MIEARMHAVAVELDFVQPVRPVWRRVDELGQLRPDPLRRTAASAPGWRATGRAMPGTGRGYGGGA